MVCPHTVLLLPGRWTACLCGPQRSCTRNPISRLTNTSKPVTSSSHYSVLLQKWVISVPGGVAWRSEKQNVFLCKSILFPSYLSHLTRRMIFLFFFKSCTPYLKWYRECFDCPLPIMCGCSRNPSAFSPPALTT